MFNRRKAITQVLALLTVENGVMLAAVALTTYGMPLVVELGIFFDVMVAVMVLGILVYRIRETFRLDGCQQAEPVERMTLLLTSILIVPAVAGAALPAGAVAPRDGVAERAGLRRHARAGRAVAAAGAGAAARGHGVGRVLPRRRPERVDGAADLGGFAGDARSTPGAISGATWRREW